MSSVERVAEVTPSAYDIETMTVHDLLEVVEIEETCGLSLWGWDSYHAELLRPEAVMLVAHASDPDGNGGRQLYGFIAARVAAGELHVNNVGVRQAERGRGIGGALLAASLERARRSGARVAVLEVRAGNSIAQALYRRHGFVASGRRRNYYREPPEDALLMSARLEPAT